MGTNTIKDNLAMTIIIDFVIVLLFIGHGILIIA